MPFAARQTWLTSAFIKFSTKSRSGKGNDIWQPSHTIRLRGKCDLEIGPHVFYATSIYEVTYQPYQAPVQGSSPYYPPSGKKVSGWPATPYTTPPGPPTPRNSAGASVYAPSTTALVSSLKGAVPITNDLISQVNTAAVSNPTLANLLGLAASGTATPEQLQTLGVTIQSLADSAAKSTTSSAALKAGSSASTSASKPSPSPVPPPTFTPPQPMPLLPGSPAAQSPVLSLRPPQTPEQSSAQPPPSQLSFQPTLTQTINKDPDVVIEFYENSSDRWTLPKDLVLYERVKRWDGNSALADIIFSTIFPFEGSKPVRPPVAQAPPSTSGTAVEPEQAHKDIVHPITLRFFNVPPAIWNLFAKAAADEERTKRVSAAIDAQLDKAAPRAYLQHRIQEGALLTQLQASASDRYPTKLIRPAAPASSVSQVKRRAPAVAKDGKEGSGPPKRKRTMQAKKPEPKMGKCEVCLRAPVALMQDSPYCPTCDKAKKASATDRGVASVTPASTSTQAQASPNASRSTAQAANFGNRQPTAPTHFTYAAGQTPVQNYYAWQNQSPYVYQPYQLHPQAQPQPQPQPQPQLQPQPQTNQPQPSQPQSSPKQATPTASSSQTQQTPQVAKTSSGSTKKKSKLAAMD